MSEPENADPNPLKSPPPNDNHVEFDSLGQLVRRLESSEYCFSENMKEYERREAKYGAVAAYTSKIQAHALLFQPNPSQMPGIDRIEGLVNEVDGTKLNSESVRRLRGRICRLLNCGTEQANSLTMHEVADTLAAEKQFQMSEPRTPSSQNGVTPMDLLLTWSGTASLGIATFFREWLPQVVPGIQPWISSQDIAKGRKWAEELTAQMSKTNISITFITPDNVRSPWIFYEVGFIAAKLASGTVCPYLIGVDSRLVS